MSKRDDLTGRRFGKLVVVKAGNTTERGVLYWDCLCDCGNKHLTTGWNLKNGHVTSCGCVRRALEDSTYKPDTYQRGLVRVYRNYTNNAEARGYEMSLTLDDVKEIISQPCHYCGRKDKQGFDFGSKRYPDRKFHYTGIDRVDNKIGYVKGNCVPCCTVCNRAKNGMSYEEFVEYLDLLVAYRKLQK